MSGFLELVVRQKADELAAKKRRQPVGELEARAGESPVRSFRSALAGGQRIIAEIKQKSPSVAGFRQQAAPADLATVYAEHGAAAISIVTDRRNFGTSLADVGRVRDVVPLPVLVKDFIIDPYQAAEARAAGADAVLLIARIVSADLLAKLIEQIDRLGMSALVECHSREDVAKAAAAGAGIIGINNRDLDTLEVSLQTARELAPCVPSRTLCVAESGITTRGHIEELSALGVDAFLIGGSLLNAPDPGRKLRQLHGDEHG